VVNIGRILKRDWIGIYGPGLRWESRRYEATKCLGPSGVEVLTLSDSVIRDACFTFVSGLRGA
jgi:hypothetical protein